MSNLSNTLSRLVAHISTTTAAGRRAFPTATLKAIQAAITEGEALHRAEIRVMVEPALPIHAILKRMPSRQRARELFSLYRIWDTEENCGVLIYINLADHKVEIITDRAVGPALDAEDWRAVCRTMTQGFAKGAYHDSALAALRQLNDLLHAHFPTHDSRTNQLSNRPLIL